MSIVELFEEKNICIDNKSMNTETEARMMMIFVSGRHSCWAIGRPFRVVNSGGHITRLSAPVTHLNVLCCSTLAWWLMMDSLCSDGCRLKSTTSPSNRWRSTVSPGCRRTVSRLK